MLEKLHHSFYMTVAKGDVNVKYFYKICRFMYFLVGAVFGFCPGGGRAFFYRRFHQDIRFDLYSDIYYFFVPFAIIA